MSVLTHAAHCEECYQKYKDAELAKRLTYNNVVIFVKKIETQNNTMANGEDSNGSNSNSGTTHKATGAGGGGTSSGTNNGKHENSTTAGDDSYPVSGL